VPAIQRRGLLCGKSMGKRPIVWLHSPAHSFGAALHTVRRHGGRVEAVVILLVDVPREWLRRNREVPAGGLPVGVPAGGGCRQHRHPGGPRRR
jgi:hypothetical protein